MKLLSRRSFLRGTLGGAAVSLALPPLEAMLTSRGAYADGQGEAPFFGLFFWANGLPWHAGHGATQATEGHPDLWTPAATGAGYAPSALLQPLARHRVSVATGLTPTTEIPRNPPGQADGHMRGFMVALTGDRPRSQGFDHGSHTLTSRRESLDQYVARHPEFYTAQPRFRSLIAGVSRARFHSYGHWNAISYNGPDSTNLPVLDPQALYDFVFAVPAEATVANRRARALDAVLEDARRLETRLGMADRQRLAQHLEHVENIQRRLSDSGGACTAPARPASQGSLLERTDAMASILATAVHCGLTRVFSFMLTAPASTHVFDHLGVPDGMHKTCHDGHWTRVRDITTHHMEAFARFLDAFEALPLPSGGTLADNGVILGTSEYGEGWKHGVREFPVVLAGGACGRLQRGVHVRAPGQSLSRAHLTVLRALGLTDASFGFNGGETSDPLTEIAG